MATSQGQGGSPSSSSVPQEALASSEADGPSQTRGYSPNASPTRATRAPLAGGLSTPASSSSNAHNISSTAASLAARIAALQKGPSSSSPTTSPRRPSHQEAPLPPSTSNLAADTSSSSISSLRSTSTASSLQTTGSGRSSSSNATSAGGSMRDRIARFQATAISEAPLIPRSSFGTPAPNPDVLKSQQRGGFPGSNKHLQGTGNWGETLRPQLTGGSWLHVGGTYSNKDQDVRPQLTGGVWGNYRAPVSRPPLPTPSGGQGSAGNSAAGTPNSSRILGGGADAFAELDGEAETETARYYRQQLEAQQEREAKEAASKSVASANGRTSTEEVEKPAEAAFPVLPDTPKTEISAEAIEKLQQQQQSEQSLSPAPMRPVKSRDRAVSRSASSDSLSSEAKLSKLPSAPAEIPRKLSNGSLNSKARAGKDSIGGRGSSGLRDPLVEVGLHGTTPEKVRQMQDKVDGMIDAGGFDLFSPAGNGQRRQPSSDLSESVPEAPTDLTLAFKAGGLTIDAASSSSSEYSEESLTEQQRNGRGLSPVMDNPIYGKGSSPLLGNFLGPNSQVGSSGSRLPDQDDGEDGDAEYSGGFAIVSAPSPSTSHHIKSPQTSRSATSAASKSDYRTKALPRRPSEDSNDEESVATPDQRYIRAAALATPSSSMKKTASFGTSASGAFTPSRPNTQKLARPPPGRIFSAAELDASDDDYEPGWANIITTRSTTN